MKDLARHGSRTGTLSAGAEQRAPPTPKPRPRTEHPAHTGRHPTALVSGASSGTYPPALTLGSLAINGNEIFHSKRKKSHWKPINHFNLKKHEPQISIILIRGTIHFFNSDWG